MSTKVVDEKQKTVAEVMPDKFEEIYELHKVEIMEAKDECTKVQKSIDAVKNDYGDIGIMNIIEKMQKEFDELREQRIALEKLGIFRGGYTYKDGIYYYLITEQVAGTRTKVYIGNEPEHVRLASEMLERYYEWSKVVAAMRSVASRMRVIRRDWEHILHLAGLIVQMEF